MNQKKTMGRQNFFARLLTLDIDDYSRFSAWLLSRLRLCYHVGLEFIQDRCLLRASSLTYTTILSIVPLMAVSFSWFSRMKLSREEVKNFLSRYLFPNAQLFRTIQDNIDKFSSNTAALSTLGTLVLFVAAYSMINTMEKSFNAIWHVTEKRSLWDKINSFWMSLTLAPILIGLSLFMTAKLKSLPVLGTFLTSPLIKASLVYLIPFLMILLAFFMLYKLLPYTRVGTRSALGGAAIGAFLFMVLKWGFALYVTHFSAYSKIYGALAAIPAFLFYLFLIWIIVLLGAEFSYVLQYPEIYRTGATGTFRPENFRGYLALRAMIEIVRRFLAGEEPPRTLAISQTLGITYDMMEKILTSLVRQGLARRIEGMRDAFVPAQDPARITVSQVVEAARGKLLLAAPYPKDPDQQYLQDLFRESRKILHEHLGGVTLMQLADKTARPPGGTASTNEQPPPTPLSQREES
ncbi:MAG: YihY family inner membrane protein [Deltaproteobacteria bacterium]|nr:YihY family inner membrane protein [Deltaproteobacteria bacterium]